MAATGDIDELCDLVGRGGVVVVSGAGISTESGIPDYRGPRPAGAPRPSPMTWARFRDSDTARRRYWARSLVGWSRFSAAQPNAGHRAVATLQQHGWVDAVITQNVDGLHQQAGSVDVLELHGRLDRIVCLDCGATSSRDDVHRRLARANPGWEPDAVERLPDGDVRLDVDDTEEFAVVGCARCGGVLKPDVVFFGESIPRARNERATDLVDCSSSLLVLGSSLEVFSGRRLVLRVAHAGRPVAVVNRGPTRADDVARPRVDAGLGETLDRLLVALGAAPGRPNR